MTARERVMEVLKMPWRRDPDPFAPGKREFLYHEELEQRLEQAIIAAEEARAKEERETCAEIADRRKRLELEMAAESRRESKQLSEVGHTFSATAADEIATQIRARSTTSPVEEKNEN